MKYSANWNIYGQTTNIKRSCDTKTIIKRPKLSNCVSRQNLNFNPPKLSHLQFTPSITFLRVDFLNDIFRC